MDYLEAILNAACLWQMVGGPSGVVKPGAFEEQGISGGVTGRISAVPATVARRDSDRSEKKDERYFGPAPARGTQS